MTTGNAHQAGLRAAADFVAGKADEYANQFGYGVAGTLCFDRQEKMDHYTTLTELAEEIRVFGSAPGEPCSVCEETGYVAEDTRCPNCNAAPAPGQVLSDEQIMLTGMKHFSRAETADAAFSFMAAVRDCLAFAAPAAPAPYKDSTPQLRIGDSSFEGWFSEYNPAGKGTKQQMRDSYAAGMGDPLVVAAPPPAPSARTGLTDAKNDAMRDALSDETPYFCRRSIAKTCYEVGRMNNADWREVISDDQTILSTHPTYAEAFLACERLEFAYRYQNFLALASRHQSGEVEG